MKQPSETVRAFTLIELLAVLTVVALCAATFLPAVARTKAPAQRIYCANNLKGVGQAFQMWGQDHGDAFPMRVAIANGGYADYVGIRSVATTQPDYRGVFGFFMVMSNELTSPEVLICPAENESRTAATTFDGVTRPNSPGIVPLTNDLNISYFVGVDAVQTNPRAFLAGDHNLGSDGHITPIVGFATAPQSYHPDFKVSLGTNFVTNAGVGWLNTMHSNQGNVGIADGSVSQYNRVQLQQALRNASMSPTGVGIPFPSPTGCSGPEVNRIQFP